MNAKSQGAMRTSAYIYKWPDARQLKDKSLTEAGGKKYIYIFYTAVKTMKTECCHDAICGIIGSTRGCYYDKLWCHKDGIMITNSFQ